MPLQPPVQTRAAVAAAPLCWLYLLSSSCSSDPACRVPAFRPSQEYNHYYPAGYLAASWLERVTAVLPWPSDFHLAETADHRWGTLVPTIFFLRGIKDHDLTNG
jgi:hypothetical protein